MNFSHEKYAKQVAMLAEAIGITPEPTMDQIDDLRFCFERLKRDVERKENKSETKTE